MGREEFVLEEYFIVMFFVCYLEEFFENGVGNFERKILGGIFVCKKRFISFLVIIENYILLIELF